MKAWQSLGGRGLGVAVAVVSGVGGWIHHAAAQDGATPVQWLSAAESDTASATTAEQAQGGIQLRNVPPFPGIANGCQTLVSPATAFVTGPAFRRADNFKPVANSTINGVSWTGYYRQVASQTAATAPAGETFEISFRSDAAGVPGTVIAGPFTVTPTSTVDGTFGAGGPTLYDYVATLPSGVAVPGGQCTWLEIRNTSTSALRWFWHAAGAIPGDTVSYVTGVGDSTFNDFEQVAADLAFCLDIEIESVLGGAPCAVASIPGACANPDANGQPRAGATTGFSSNLAGSTTVTGGSSVAFERAEAFRLTNSGSITNVCFYAFWNAFGAAGGGNVGGGFPALPDLQLTYYNADPTNNLLPGSVLNQFTVGQGGVSMVFDGTGIHRIDHPAVAVAANTCYYISISYRSDVNDAARHSRFIWGWSNSAASNTDGLVLTRTTNTSPIGEWTYTPLTAPARGMSFLFNVGDAVLPCTPAPQANVSCTTATPLTLNGPGILGNNAGMPFSVMPPCQFDLVFGGLAWFSFVGDGNTVTLSTCNTERVGDPNLNVYCATNCAGSFNCILGNDDLGTLCASGALAAGVSLPTVAGQTYYATVHGTGNTVAVFRINATSDLTPANPPAAACGTFVRCENSALPASVSETDPCSTSTATNTNATCATATLYPAFGTTVGGRVSTYLNGTTQTRDFDFWRLPAVSQPTRVTWKINSEFPTLYQFQNFGATGCTGTAAVLVGATRLACLDQFQGEVTLPANSTVVLLISVPDFQGLACPNFNDYRLTVSIVPEGACCVTATACFVDTENACTTQAGVFQGANSTCTPTDPCVATAIGACCAGTTCTSSAQAACTGTFTRYAGDNTTCNVPGNFVTPCCKADYNQGGAVTVQDIFDFLADYFSANPRADINGGGTSVQDIFDFLAVYFAGCP